MKKVTVTERLYELGTIYTPADRANLPEYTKHYFSGLVSSRSGYPIGSVKCLTTFRIEINIYK